MTENRRIFWNVIATYGRSLYGLVLGLLCGRWALMALGETDYGLNGLVGGLAVFIAFFNNVLAGANARFYAFSIGAAKVAEDRESALEECRRWFNIALFVHTIVPVVLIVVGYPLGVYAVKHWLTIPLERIDACVWVFRFVCLSCFVGMVNVPFSAMYTAKQYIAELTLYSFITATLNAVALYYMVTHPGLWLAKYAAFTCLISIVPQVVICLRAIWVFPECQINIKYMLDLSRVKRLGAFSGWQMLGMLCAMLRSNGLSIVVNKLFGARMNAAQTIGNSVQGHCFTLSGAMQSAFTPVITQSCGAGDYVKMNKFVIRTCKFNVFLSLIFVIPLALELPKVMALWLGTPPSFATGLCYCAMLLHLVGAATAGHMIAVNATGRIAGYHVTLCLINIFVLPVSVLVGLVWKNVYAVMGVVIAFEMLNSIGRLCFSRKHAKTSMREWVRFVALPSLSVGLICGIVGFLPQLLFAPSPSRVCITILTCEVILLPTLWFVVLNSEEREFVKRKMFSRLISKSK